MAETVFFLVTVDGDLRVGTPAQQKAGVRAMREVHASLGLRGKTSWMINELDFEWTEKHLDLLLDLAHSGECIGVHDHLDTYFAESYEDVFPLMQQSRSRLMACLSSEGIEPARFLTAHRNGCAMQSEPSYRAAIDLGYSIVSDVRPELVWWARMVKVEGMPNSWRALEVGDPRAVCTDNRRIPLPALPWRHGADNWLETTSREGPLTHIPVTCLPWLERDRVEAVIEGNREEAFVLLDTHPYDLQDPGSGEISEERVDSYQRALEWVIEDYHPTFIRLDQAAYYSAQRLEGIQHSNEAGI
jgi:hypothetical protein